LGSVSVCRVIPSEGLLGSGFILELSRDCLPGCRKLALCPFTCERANQGANHERSGTMKYMLMMHAPRAGWEKAGIGTWPPEDINQIAARASAAPGKGGAPVNMAIEVREVMSAPPVDM
jgi:hypothetical protein